MAGKTIDDWKEWKKFAPRLVIFFCRFAAAALAGDNWL
jgi:hypothetical protein